MLRKFLVHWDLLMCLRTVTLPIDKQVRGCLWEFMESKCQGPSHTECQPWGVSRDSSQPQALHWECPLNPCTCWLLWHSGSQSWCWCGHLYDRRYIHTPLTCMGLHASTPLQHELACMRAWKPAAPWSGLFFPFHCCLCEFFISLPFPTLSQGICCHSLFLLSPLCSLRCNRLCCGKARESGSSETLSLAQT